jgi:hypothetical protein
MKKASPGLERLELTFNPFLQTAILDACLDAIFGLNQITTLYLIWNRMSLDKIKSALKKRKGMKRYDTVFLGYIDQEMNDADILEICSYLPSLNEWIVICHRSTISIDGAREWKRICPNLETVKFAGRGLSEEVKEALKGLGVSVI